MLFFVPLYAFVHPLSLLFFFFNDTATTEIYTLSLHDALPICLCRAPRWRAPQSFTRAVTVLTRAAARQAQTSDRKSTRLNSSHSQISYAVFCLKKKKKSTNEQGILTSQVRAY